MVVERLQKGLQPRHIRREALLVVPPATDCRSIKWFLDIRMGRRIDALRAGVLEELQDVFLKAHAEKLQHRPSHGRQVVYQLLLADIRLAAG